MRAAQPGERRRIIAEPLDFYPLPFRSDKSRLSSLSPMDALWGLGWDSSDSLYPSKGW
jgi:hypothetical protein